MPSGSLLFSRSILAEVEGPACDHTQVVDMLHDHPIVGMIGGIVCSSDLFHGICIIALTPDRVMEFSTLDCTQHVSHQSR